MAARLDYIQRAYVTTDPYLHYLVSYLSILRTCTHKAMHNTNPPHTLPATRYFSVVCLCMISNLACRSQTKDATLCRPSLVWGFPLRFYFLLPQITMGGGEIVLSACRFFLCANFGLFFFNAPRVIIFFDSQIKR